MLLPQQNRTLTKSTMGIIPKLHNESPGTGEAGLVKWGGRSEKGCAIESVTVLTTTDPMGIIIISGSTLDSLQYC